MHVLVVLFADLMESPPSGAALSHHSLPRVASSSYKARHPSKILIFACEKLLSHLRQITNVVPCVTYDSKVEDLCAEPPTVDTWRELGDRPLELEAFWKLEGKAARCE